MYAVVKIAFAFPFALLVGFMAIVQWSLVPAQNSLDGPAYTTLEKGMNDVMQTLTPALMIATLIAGSALVAIAWKRASKQRALYALALSTLVAMIITTLLINAPVNAAVDAWNASAPPADWMALRDRWELGHAIRSYVGLAGLFAAIVGLAFDDERVARH